MDNNADFSEALEKVKDMLSGEDEQNLIRNIFKSLTTTSDTSSDNENSGTCTEDIYSPENNTSTGFDMDMFLKLQKIMSLMQTDKADPRTDFLRTLKPFLRQNRRDKLDQAIKFINALRVIKQFKAINEGSD